MKKNWYRPAAIFVTAATLAGCATMSGTGRSEAAAQGVSNPIVAHADQFASGEPVALQPFFKALYIEGEHNAVLNFDYLGLAALDTGHYSVAAKALDAAITRIQAIYANNPSAQKAKSLFAAEKVKDFKGEPYERAMTYFYRGLLYARVGDYQNARASFLSAEEQSMMSYKETYKNTFGLMDYLAGWASHCDGDQQQAADFERRAVKTRPAVFSGQSDKVNFVGLVDIGTGPVKYGKGKYKQKLAFRPSAPMPAVPAIAVSDVKVGQPRLAANLDYQAMTRGGRPVDAILNGKAQWKAKTSGASSLLASAGEVATLQGLSSGNQSLQEGGEIGMAVSLIGKLFAHAMNPAADTREWRSLPAGIVLVEGNIDGPSAPAMSITSSHSQDPVEAQLNAQAGKCAISWGDMTSGLTLASRAVAHPVPDEAGHEAANRALRSFLESTFQPQRAAGLTASQPTSRSERDR